MSRRQPVRFGVGHEVAQLCAMVAGGVLGAGARTIFARTGQKLGAPVWKPPHPPGDSITVATKVACNQTLTRGHPFQQTEKTLGQIRLATAVGSDPTVAATIGCAPAVVPSRCRLPCVSAYPVDSIPGRAAMAMTIRCTVVSQLIGIGRSPVGDERSSFRVHNPPPALTPLPSAHYCDGIADLLHHPQCVSNAKLQPVRRSCSADTASHHLYTLAWRTGNSPQNSWRSG